MFGLMCKSTHNRIVRVLRAELKSLKARQMPMPVTVKVAPSKRGIWRWQAFDGDELKAIQPINVHYDSAEESEENARRVMNTKKVIVVGG